MMTPPRPRLLALCGGAIAAIIIIAGILWLPPLAERWRTNLWIQVERNQQAAKEICTRIASDSERRSYLAARTLEYALSDFQTDDLSWVGYDRMQKGIYLNALDTVVIAREWEWDSHWESGSKEEETTRHRLAYPVNLKDMPYLVEFELEDIDDKVWTVRASGTADFNCAVESRGILGVETHPMRRHHDGPVADLWLTMEQFDIYQ